LFNGRQEGRGEEWSEGDERHGRLSREVAVEHRRSERDTRRGPWKLVYYEAYTDREDAEGREKFLKSGAGRRFLRTQLRHYFRVNRFAPRGSDHDSARFD
jgi:hypothetical protein